MKISNHPVCRPNAETKYNIIHAASSVMLASTGVPPADSINIGKTIAQQVKIAEIPTQTGKTLQAEYITSSIKSAIKKIIKLVARK